MDRGARGAGLRRRLVPRSGGPRTFLLRLILYGLLAGCRSPGGPFELRGVTEAAALAAVEAGVASCEFTPEPGYPLAGYGTDLRRVEWPFLWGGGWPGRLSLDIHQAWNGDDPDERADFLAPASGAHDGLFARALVLVADGPPIALCRLDIVIVTELLHAAVAERVRDMGFRPEGVVLAATHTHSSVGGYDPSRFARLAALDNYRPEIFERIVDAAARAIRQAFEARRPAALGLGRADDRGLGGEPSIAENRRTPVFGEDPDDTDAEVGLLKVVDAETGATLAVLVNFAVHPIVLGPENLYYSADLAGAIERALADRLPGHPPVLFFNGAEGDIVPRGGHGGLARVRELADLFARRVAPAIDAIATSDRAAIACAAGDRDFGDPFLIFTLGSREAFLAADDSIPLRLLTSPLTLPANLLLWIAGFTNARLALNWNLTLGIRFDLSPYTDRTTGSFHAIRILLGTGEDALILTLPGEAIHTLGERFKAEGLARGADHVLFLGLANGYLMYVTDPAEYDRGGFEARMTLFGLDTGPRCAEALGACMDAVGLGRRP